MGHSPKSIKETHGLYLGLHWVASFPFDYTRWVAAQVFFVNFCLTLIPFTLILQGNAYLLTLVNCFVKLYENTWDKDS